jgi:D-lactate dehydrogenase (cytochrome)
VAAYLQDAAHTPGGHTPRVLFPRSEAEVAEALRQAPAALPIGAQSSLTGGATPFGEWVLSLARLDGIYGIGADRVRVGAGVALVTLLDRLRGRGLSYPPVPTFTGACVGGVVATNAAGAQTFKHGSTRDWVRSLTVVLASGDVLDLERGAVRADAKGRLEVVLTTGEPREVRVPAYRLPDVPKRSAGYYAEPGLDLLDLFVGSEGSLGVVTEVELRLVPARPRLVGFLTLPGEADLLALAAALRDASRQTWRSGDPRGIDVCAIESMDGRCLALLREAGADRQHGVVLSAEAGAALLFQMELPAEATDGDVLEALAGAGSDHPAARLARLLGRFAPAEEVVLALPGQRARAEQLLALREAVPLLVNERVAAAQRIDPAVQKVAGDMIVPFDRLGEALAGWRAALGRRELDHAVWGHVSDGNLHANVLPRSAAEVESGFSALLEMAVEVIRLGGCPLSEHGVGRSPAKQQMLRLLVGEGGIADMRRVKEALDPAGKLAPGVLFPPR